MSIARSLARSIAQPLARSLAGGEGAGGGGPAPLNILANVGTSTSPTSTGLQAITGVGFVPKLVMPLSALVTSDGNSGGGSFNFGAATDISEATVSVTSATSVTTSDTDRRHNNAAAIDLLSFGVVSESAGLSSLDSDGFTLNWTNVNASLERILNHICLGGDDLEVSLTQHQMNNTNAPQSFAHGLTGGAPTGLLAFDMGSGAAPPVTSASAVLSIGGWANNSQFAASLASVNAVTTTLSRRILATNRMAGFGWTTSGVIQRSLSVASVDATNVNATYVDTDDLVTRYFWLLAIRGAKCLTGTFDCNGSTSPLTIATPGITPKLALFFFVPSGVDSINTIQNNLLFAIGASDGTNNTSCGISDANNVTTTNARRYQSSTTLVEYDTAGTKTFEATAAFSGESVVIDPTVNSGTSHGQGSFLIIGA